MASVRKEIVIEADPAAVWDALRDWGALHRRLVPGFAVDTRLDGGDRIVTFFNGAVAREVLVTCDEDARRLVWTITESPLGYEHHNGAAQVLDGPDGGARFVWIADVLPDSVEPTVRAMMERGTEVIRHTMEARGHDSVA